MKYFHENEQVVAFSSLQISEGASNGLVELTLKEIDAHLNPKQKMTTPVQKAAITAHRWTVETSGIVMPSGVQVATALDDQNRITTVVANARLAGLDSVKFKAASGWVTLSLAEVEAIAAAIAMHVQACFAAECAHHEAIDALANAHAHDDEALQTALNAYDTSQGWPAADLREPASA